MKRIVTLTVAAICFSGMAFATSSQERALEANLERAAVNAQQQNILRTEYINFDEIFASTKDLANGQAIKEIKSYFSGKHSHASIFNMGMIGEKSFLSTLLAGDEYKAFYIAVFQPARQGNLVVYYTLELYRSQGWADSWYILSNITPVGIRQIAETYTVEDMVNDRLHLQKLEEQLQQQNLPLNTLQVLTKSEMLQDIKKITVVGALPSIKSKKVQAITLRLEKADVTITQTFKYYPVHYKYEENPQNEMDFRFLGFPVVIAANATSFLR